MYIVNLDVAVKVDVDVFLGLVVAVVADVSVFKF